MMPIQFVGNLTEIILQQPKEMQKMMVIGYRKGQPKYSIQQR